MKTLSQPNIEPLARPITAANDSVWARLFRARASGPHSSSEDSVRLHAAAEGRCPRSFGVAIVVLIITGVIVLAAIAVSARAWLAPSRAVARQLQGQGQTENKPAPSKIRAMLLTLRPHGFEPKKFTWPRKQFLLVVENRSMDKDITLRLDRVAGNRLREVPVDKRKLSWAERLDLPPGNYKLSVAGHPEWICAITIAPQ